MWLVLNNQPRSVEELTSRIIVYQEKNISNVLERVQNLEDLIIERGVKLIVLDSIAAPVRYMSYIYIYIYLFLTLVSLSLSLSL